MKTQHTRLKKLEQKAEPIEREFVDWPHNRWTEEEKAEAIRKDPTCRIFWRSLLYRLPTAQPPKQ